MRLLIICTLIFLASCSSIKPGTPEKDEGPVSILTGKTGGTKISDLVGSKNDSGSAMPVNAILWRASLEIVSKRKAADQACEFYKSMRRMLGR